MSILISPSDNRGWGSGMRRRSRSSMRGVGVRRAGMTLRKLLGLGTSRRRRGTRRMRGGRVRRAPVTSTRIVAVKTIRRRRRR